MALQNLIDDTNSNRTAAEIVSAIADELRECEERAQSRDRHFERAAIARVRTIHKMLASDKHTKAYGVSEEDRGRLRDKSKSIISDHKAAHPSMLKSVLGEMFSADTFIRGMTANDPVVGTLIRGYRAYKKSSAGNGDESKPAKSVGKGKAKKKKFQDDARVEQVDAATAHELKNADGDADKDPVVEQLKSIGRSIKDLSGDVRRLKLDSASTHNTTNSTGGDNKVVNHNDRNGSQYDTRYTKPVNFKPEVVGREYAHMHTASDNSVRVNMGAGANTANIVDRLIASHGLGDFGRIVGGKPASNSTVANTTSSELSNNAVRLVIDNSKKPNIQNTTTSSNTTNSTSNASTSNQHGGKGGVTQGRKSNTKNANTKNAFLNLGGGNRNTSTNKTVDANTTTSSNTTNSTSNASTSNQHGGKGGVVNGHRNVTRLSDYRKAKNVIDAGTYLSNVGDSVGSTSIDRMRDQIGYISNSMIGDSGVSLSNISDSSTSTSTSNFDNKYALNNTSNTSGDSSDRSILAKAYKMIRPAKTKGISGDDVSNSSESTTVTNNRKVLGTGGGIKGAIMRVGAAMLMGNGGKGNTNTTNSSVSTATTMSPSTGIAMTKREGDSSALDTLNAINANASSISTAAANDHSRSRSISTGRLPIMRSASRMNDNNGMASVITAIDRGFNRTNASLSSIERLTAITVRNQMADRREKFNRITDSRRDRHFYAGNMKTLAGGEGSGNGDDSGSSLLSMLSRGIELLGGGVGGKGKAGKASKAGKAGAEGAAKTASKEVKTAEKAAEAAKAANRGLGATEAVAGAATAGSVAAGGASKLGKVGSIFKVAGKGLKVVPYVGTAIDAGVGVYEGHNDEEAQKRYGETSEAAKISSSADHALSSATFNTVSADTITNMGRGLSSFTNSMFGYDSDEYGNKVGDWKGFGGGTNNVKYLDHEEDSYLSGLKWLFGYDSDSSSSVKEKSSSKSDFDTNNESSRQFVSKIGQGVMTLGGQAIDAYKGQPAGTAYNSLTSMAAGGLNSIPPDARNPLSNVAAGELSGNGDAADITNHIIHNESRGRNYDKNGNVLTSKKGARGRMQVMPKTAHQPGYNITPVRNESVEEYERVGRELIVALYKKYKGDPEKVMAAYNWGPTAVDRVINQSQETGADWRAALPEETRKYISYDKLNGTSLLKEKLAYVRDARVNSSSGSNSVNSSVADADKSAIVNDVANTDKELQNSILERGGSETVSTVNSDTGGEGDRNIVNGDNTASKTAVTHINPNTETYNSGGSVDTNHTANSYTVNNGGESSNSIDSSQRFKSSDNTNESATTINNTNIDNHTYSSNSNSSAYNSVSNDSQYNRTTSSGKTLQQVSTGHVGDSVNGIGGGSSTSISTMNGSNYNVVEGGRRVNGPITNVDGSSVQSISAPITLASNDNIHGGNVNNIASVNGSRTLNQTQSNTQTGGSVSTSDGNMHRNSSIASGDSVTQVVGGDVSNVRNQSNSSSANSNHNSNANVNSSSSNTNTNDNTAAGSNLVLVDGGVSDAKTINSGGAVITSGNHEHRGRDRVATNLSNSSPNSSNTTNSNSNSNVTNNQNGGNSPMLINNAPSQTTNNTTLTGGSLMPFNSEPTMRRIFNDVARSSIFR